MYHSEFIPEAPHDGHAQSSDNKYKQILRNRSVQLMALWICAYVGVEVTLGSGREKLIPDIG